MSIKTLIAPIRTNDVDEGGGGGGGELKHLQGPGLIIRTVQTVEYARTCNARQLINTTLKQSMPRLFFTKTKNTKPLIQP